MALAAARIKEKNTDQKPTDLRGDMNPLVNTSKELTLGGIDGIRRVLHLETKNEKRTRRVRAKVEEQSRCGKSCERAREQTMAAAARGAKQRRRRERGVEKVGGSRHLYRDVEKLDLEAKPYQAWHGPNCRTGQNGRRKAQ